MEEKLNISVLIPTLNRAESLKRCLDSLALQKYKNFEVIVIDGGSKDGTKELVEEYSDKLTTVFTVQSGGLIPQQNRGLELASGDVVIRTDDDVIASPIWIGEVVKAFNSSDSVGGVTGPTMIPEDRRKYRDLFHFQEKLAQGGIFWRLIGKIYFDYFLEGEPFTVGKWFKSGGFSLGSNYPESQNLKEPIEVTHQEACNMATRKDILEKIGGFDETFVGIGEFNEADVSFKIRELGYKIIFSPTAKVQHIPSKEGFFKDRPNSYGRVLNFITFYFRHIKPNTPDKFVRFFSYLLFINGFWTYKFLTTREIGQLGCIPGTIVGLSKNMFKKSSWEGGF